MRSITGWRALIALGVVVLSSERSSAEDHPRDTLGFTVKLEVAQQALTPEFCWFHPRTAAIPGAGENGKPAVVMTLQKHLKVSDYYSGMWTMRTDNLGGSWTGPTEIPELGWTREDSGVVVAVADVTPGWHEPTGRLLAIGCSVRYSPEGQQLSDTKRPSQTAYAAHDPTTGAWSTWQTLEMPPDEKFDFARNGCSQWMVEPDGSVLVPIYFAKSADVPASVTVVRCRFDGRKLTYLEHGTELVLSVVRGLCEPSLAKFKDRYYMTIRNDLKGYVATSDDGLHFGAIEPWTFDDGEDLGSYNTQQHWLVHTGGLFLAYTRRGADNDHIFRHRAPLFLAQVDPEKLCVVRSTERVLIPERGAQMGNFGAAAISPNESWVTVSEYMAGDKPDPRGADGSTFVARVIWSKPNGLVSQGSRSAPP
jgi:hypothetical protein